MGALVARTLEATGRFEVAGVYDVDTIDALADAAAADVAIDFSHLSAIPQVAAYVARTGTALVSGTTGLGEEELALLREAQRITDEAFTHMCGFIKPGMTEKEIRVELENYMLTHGADGLSFESIVAGGPNGANPHAQPSEYRVQKGDFIVLDYGALYHDYHADMTRTVILGEPTEEQRHVYDIVRLAHETCAATAKPGCIGKDIHNLAVKVISDNGYGDYFAHGLGHGVGLEIHEKPVFGRTYEGEVPVGSVITVEPGIYLPGRFGIRLEDTGVMTEDGYAPFATSPHELVVIDCG